jgi:hypothetical protein
MASSYSTSLKIQLIGNGEQSGVWGTTTNTNWNLIEQAVAGVQAITMSNANYTLTNLNGVSDEARNAVLKVGGTNSGVYQIIAPLVNKTYIVTNNTTGGYAITIGGASGSIVSIPNGVTSQVYCDGTNFYSSVTGSAGNFLVNGTLTASGVADVGDLTVSGNATFAGNTTAVTQASSDNSTKVATTAFVQTKVGTLGTMASQNANAVTITGGSITGTTISGANVTANTAASIANSGGWSVTPSGTKLYFNYNGTNVASLDNSGNLIVIGNVTASGTP